LAIKYFFKKVPLPSVNPAIAEKRKTSFFGGQSWNLGVNWELWSETFLNLKSEHFGFG
jgi:hypothetical protein